MEDTYDISHLLGRVCFTNLVPDVSPGEVSLIKTHQLGTPFTSSPSKELLFGYYVTYVP